MKSFFEPEGPVQGWDDPDTIVVSSDGARVMDLSSVAQCVDATAAVRSAISRIEEMLAHEASNRVKATRHGTRPRDPEFLARLSAHRRNAKTAMQRIEAKRMEMARVEKEARAEESRRRNVDQGHLILGIVKEMDKDLFMRALEEARRRSPDAFTE